MKHAHARKTHRPGACGQALAEMGLVILLLVTMLLGIIEFGRMLMLTNMVVHAARDGARIAAVTPGSDFSTVEQHVRDLLGSNVVGLDVAVAADDGTGNGTGIDTVTVTVTGEILYIFPGWWGPSLEVARSVTFRRETSA